MSLPARWMFTLARSSDMRPIGPLRNISNYRLNLVYNRPGTFGFQIPIDERIAYSIRKRSTCVLLDRINPLGGVRRIWSGPVTNVEDDASEGGDMTAVICNGWMEELDHRHLRVEDQGAATFTDVVGGEVAQTLLRLTNAHTDTSGTVRPTHVVPGSVLDTQIRTAQYRAGQNVGQAIRDLSDIENGYDFWVDPYTRQMHTRAPQSFADRTELHFGYGIHPHNLARARRADDGTRVANRFVAVGSGGIYAPADDPMAIDDAGVMLEEQATLSDVSSLQILGAYANAELVFKRYGVVTYDISPRSVGDVPRLFDEFELGDSVSFSVDRGRFQVRSQAVRTFTATIGWDEAGYEMLEALGTSPS